MAFSQNAHKRTNVDDYGFRWVKWDAWARAQGKTTEKEAQMVVSHLFWQGHGGKKNEEVGRDGWGDHTGLFRGMPTKKGV